jgi:hypothetical protein
VYARTDLRHSEKQEEEDDERRVSQTIYAKGSFSLRATILELSHGTMSRIMSSSVTNDSVEEADQEQAEDLSNLKLLLVSMILEK